ncbi:MAG: FAD-binding oxidoreductase [Rhizobiaceae bacterium]|nr:FAD-binding oxidoreductase [Rhizobiaceae bacterium]
MARETSSGPNPQETMPVPAFESLMRQLPAEALLIGDAIEPRFRETLSEVPAARPAFVMRPRNTREVSICLSTCDALHQPVAVQGGRTGFHGGERACPGEAILSLERMTDLAAVDVAGGSIEAQAGVPLQRVQEAAVDAGMYFGVDIGSRGSATIGGNVASNAGGIRVLRYGMFRAQVLGVEAVLADGTVLTSLKGLAKDNSGLDLNQLFIGSEGTLGVVTRACLKLHPRPAAETAAFCAVPSLAAAVKLLSRLRVALGPLLSAFELIFADAFEGALALRDTQRPVAAAPFYVLAELHALHAEHDIDVFAAALASAHEDGIVSDVTLAQSPREFAALWALRDACSEHLSTLDRLVACDISVQPARMETFVAEAGDSIRALDPTARFPVFGHLGDGNLHYIIQTDRPADVVDGVYRCVQRLGGSIAAEHGIGIDKKPYLHFSRSDAEIATMRRLKRAFDPNNILNPGRIFDAVAGGSAQGAVA